MKTALQDSSHVFPRHAEKAWSAFGATHRGRVRRCNEDAFLCDEEAGVFLVCDGMGGAAAGEVASHLAAENAVAALHAGDLTTSGLKLAVRAANAAVFERACADRRLEGMGTTLVMLAISQGHASIAHVGDSRCYLFRDDTLTRLTVDHSLVEEQIQMGRISRRQAERSALAHVITRAVGTMSEVLPDVQELDVRPGDLFLLASDGLTRELSEDNVAELLGRYAHEKAAAEALVAAANAAGGRDNITCVLVRVR